jgi:hypothetical protein
MAKTTIGEPIPLGKIPSFTDSLEAENAPTKNPEATIDALRSDILPTMEAAAPMIEAQVALPSGGFSASQVIFDIMQTSWQASLMPAIAWTSYLAASWKALENTIQPEWPAR